MRATLSPLKGCDGTSLIYISFISRSFLFRSGLGCVTNICFTVWVTRAMFPLGFPSFFVTERVALLLVTECFHSGTTCMQQKVSSWKTTLCHATKNSHRHHSYTPWTIPEKQSCIWVGIWAWRADDEVVNQVPQTGNQIAHMLMLPASCQQDMKLNASWTHRFSRVGQSVPLLLDPVASAGSSPQYNSVGFYLSSAGELELQTEGGGWRRVDCSSKPVSQNVLGTRRNNTCSP